MKTNRYLSAHKGVAPSDTPITGTSTHDAIPLPGCVVRTALHVDVLGWMSRVLRCVENSEPPSSRHFMNFDATFQVQTFDDIDVCVKIAAKALSLDPIATIGLRELMVNAVEHGNLEIDFDHKSALLASGEWQDEIERRLSTSELGIRFATVQLSRDDHEFTVQITDQGPGFDWRSHLDPDTAPTHMLHGRGMSLAMAGGFDSVEYRGAGNQVAIRGVCAPDQDF